MENQKERLKYLYIDPNVGGVRIAELNLDKESRAPFFTKEVCYMSDYIYLEREFEYLQLKYPCPVSYEDFIFPSAQHCYLYLMARYHCVKHNHIEVPYLYKQVKMSKTLDKAELVCQDCHTVDWYKNHAIRIMAQINRNKICEERTFFRHFISSGNRPIICETDQYWGIVDGKGSNYLGRILMKIRENYRREV